MSALVTENLSLLAGAPGGVFTLRRLILNLALSGRLTASADKAQNSDGVVPVGWQKVTVGSITECLDRLRQPITKQDRQTGSTPYYGASGIVDYVADHIFDEPLVLVGEDGAKWGAGEATAFRIEGRAWVNNHAHVLRPNRELVLDRFLELSLVAADLAPFITGMTVPKLNQARLNSIPIALPPLAEQHRIVAKVDELMALCDRLEAQQADAEAAHAKLVEALLASLTQARDAADFRASWQQLAEHFHTLFTTEASIDALKQTVLQLGALGKLAAHTRDLEQRHASIESISVEDEPFSLPSAWRWVRLGSLCELVTSGSRGWKEFYADSGSIFIRSQDIKSDKLEFDNRAFVRLPLSAEGARTLVAKDDLLVTITGANVGKAAHLAEPVEDAYVSQHVALIRLRDPALSPFIHRWLTNSLGGRAMLLASSYGAKPGLNLQNIKDLPIPLPPVAEQREIVAKTDELLALCDQLKLNLGQARQHHERLASVLVEQAVA